MTYCYIAAFAVLNHRKNGHNICFSMVGPLIAIQSARNYCFLCEKGVTVRKTIDSLIATFCIENGHDLLHSDADFDPYERYLGLSVIHP